jgi:hypothetical protein
MEPHFRIPGEYWLIFFLSYRHVNLANATHDELEQLTQACDPAPFGLEGKDVLDETYRKAAKMNPDRFASPLHPSQTDLIEIIRDYLLEGTQSSGYVVAELHKLNVYSTHPIFVPIPSHPPETKSLPRQRVFL